MIGQRDFAISVEIKGRVEIRIAVIQSKLAGIEVNVVDVHNFVCVKVSGGGHQCDSDSCPRGSSIRVIAGKSPEVSIERCFNRRPVLQHTCQSHIAIRNNKLLPGD